MLQLVNYTNIRMVEGMKNISEQNAHQSQSIAVLAYDAKRDSEVMKAITVVTILFPPATFVSVRSVLHLKLTTHPAFQTIFSTGSSISITTSSSSPDKVGFISLAHFRSLLSSSERHLGGYGGQGRRKKSLLITLLVKRFHKRPIH